MDLKGKIVNFLGDSITEGAGVGDIPNCRYDNYIKNEYGLKAANNYGISGTRLAHQMKAGVNPSSDLCFCGRAYHMDKNADIVVVYGGVNDYIHGDAPIGQKGDRYPETFWGGVSFLMRHLKDLYPGKTIVFVTPAHCYYEGVHDYEVSKYPIKKTDAMPLIEYVKIIEEMGKEYGVPVLNLFEKLGIDPNKPEDYEKYTVDGLHFNNEGQKILAKCIADFILSL